MRQSSVICYLTSLRPNVPASMADDQVRVVFEHLLRLGERPIKKLDVFLVSNGGSGTVPWRLVSVFREYSSSFNVLIPYRAYSAATMLALGADEIVMHPFGELGPIDPTVANDFNPTHPNTGRTLGISVEDVRAYVNFIKSTVGIRHEDELVQAIGILANKVHPLALGNVERFVAQSRMIARKIMKTRQNRLDDHTIDEIVENLASRLYFHGHPISRREARDDLDLSSVVEEPGAQLENLMWQLYREYEIEFENDKVWDPEADIFSLQSGDEGAARREIEYRLLHAMVESQTMTSRNETIRRWTEFPIPNAPPGQTVLMERILSQAWTHLEGAAAEDQRGPSS